MGDGWNRVRARADRMGERGKGDMSGVRARGGRERIWSVWWEMERWILFVLESEEMRR